jgi:hypothetical protein
MRRRSSCIARAAAVGVALLALLIAGAPASAQDRAVRFEIVAVGDTTITLRTGEERWLRPGQAGVAVDPRKRDELVGRFRVMRVEEGQAVAIITGQTTRLTIDHVGVLTEPRRPWYRSRGFWAGLIGGLIAGFAAGKI